MAETEIQPGQDLIEEGRLIALDQLRSINLMREQLKELRAEGESFGHPSYLKYGALYLFAGTSDIVKWLEFTGIGIIITVLVCGGCFVASYIICLLSGTKADEAKDYVRTLEGRVRQIGKDTVRATRLASMVFGVEKIAASPIGSVLLGQGLDVIPFLNIFNLSVVWVYVAYRSEKKLYQHAARSAGMLAEESDALAA